MNQKNGIEFADFLGLASLYLGAKNLVENEQQSDAQLKILQQIDIGAANDNQATYLLQELSKKFDEQNAMLEKILKAVEK